MTPPKWEYFLHKDNTINVVSNQNIWYIDLFFGPIWGQVDRPFDRSCFLMPNSTTRISEVLLALELATTRTWCRKNNWDWEIPQGYSEVKFGMKKIKLCLLISPQPQYTVEEIDEFEHQAMVRENG